MTVLYRCEANAQQIAAHFGIEAGNDPWPGGYGAPNGFVPVITAGREFIAGPSSGRQPWRMVPRLWGVPPPPAAGGPTRAVLNVRNMQSPFWIGNLRNPEFRCLIPATAFMEWGTGTDRDGKRRQHWFTLSDQPLFAFAAIAKDGEVPGFALLSTEPNAEMQHIGRDTMPAILPAHRGAWATWLHAGWDKASQLVQPYSSSLMQEA